MKRYTLCAIILACIASCTSGCGKTDYNDFMKGYAQLKENCLESGGLAFKYENDRAICVCNNAECDLVCTETGKCHECEDGETRCENSEYQYCDGHIWHTDGNCIVNPNVCENDCEDKTLKKCTKDPVTNESQTIEITCEYGCINNNNELRCLGKTCTDEGTMKCNGDYLEVCVEGHINSTYCPFGCENNTCRSSQKNTCAKAEEKCEVSTFQKPVHYKCVEHKDEKTGEQLPNTWEVFEICESNACDVQMKACGCEAGINYTCDEDNNNRLRIECQSIGSTNYTKLVSTEIIPCENGCQNGVCRCKDEEKQCVGNYVESCINGKWEKAQKECDHFCQDGECKECLNGAKQCLADDNIVQNCVDGQWTNNECEYGCNQERSECNECKNESKRCADNTVEECRDGKWGMETKCAEEQVCFDNRCIDCYPGSKICDSNGKRECDSNGFWGAAVECKNGCNGNECKDCDPAMGSKSCRDNHLFVCGNDNQWVLEDSCESFGCGYKEDGEASCKICKVNECTDDKKTLKYCNGGFWGDQEICNTYTQCGVVNNSVKCACMEGISIVENQFKVCQEDGDFVTANKVQLKCNENKCNLSVDGIEIPIIVSEDIDGFDGFKGVIEKSAININTVNIHTICVNKLVNNNNGVTGAYSFTFDDKDSKYNVVMNYCGVCNADHNGCGKCSNNQNESREDKRYMYDGIPAVCENNSWKHDSNIKLHDCAAPEAEEHYLYNPQISIDKINKDFCNLAIGINVLNKIDWNLENFNSEYIGCYDSLYKTAQSMYIYNDNDNNIQYRSCGTKTVSIGTLENITTPVFVRCNKEYNACEGDCVPGVYDMSVYLNGKVTEVCYNGTKGNAQCSKPDLTVSCSSNFSDNINTDELCLDVYDSKGNKVSYILKQLNNNSYGGIRKCPAGCNDTYSSCK